MYRLTFANLLTGQDEQTMVSDLQEAANNTQEAAQWITRAKTFASDETTGYVSEHGLDQLSEALQLIHQARRILVKLYDWIP